MFKFDQLKWPQDSEPKQKTTHQLMIAKVLEDAVINLLDSGKIEKLKDIPIEIVEVRFYFIRSLSNIHTELPG